MTDEENEAYPLKWRAVSILTSFPVILTITVISVVMSIVVTGTQAQLFGGILFLFFIIVPGLVGGVLYLTGHVSDLEVRKRDEREPILIVGMVTSLIGVYALYLAGAPEAIFRLGVMQLLMLILIFWVNGFWKISVHAISWGAALPPIFVFQPMVGIALSPCTFLMAMSRFKLDCHTVSQVIAGFLLGTIISTALFVPFA